MNHEELLQERLELLEAGMPLDDCLHGLPEELVEVLMLAVSMRELPDTQSTAIQTEQRAELVGLAAAAAWITPNTAVNGHHPDNFTQATASLATASFLAGVQAWLQRRTAMEWIVTGIMSPAILVLLVAGLWFLLNGDNGPIPVMPETMAEQQPDATVAETIATETTVNPTDTTTEMMTGAETTAAGQSSAFLPLMSYSLRLEPQTAILQEIRGQVQVSQGEDTWRYVADAAHVGSGQHIRTGSLSGATLSFYDGSYATIGPNSEIAVNVVEAQRPETGFRTIVLTQIAGESEHHVDFRNDSGSLYEVKTAYGNGIARGTTFHVLVLPDQSSRFAVTQGRVDVSGSGRTVNVLAGQLTTVAAEETPSTPTFYISGEGEVTTIEENIWTIAGQIFETHENTLIWGDPQVGDLVFVDGRLLSDGTKLADRIILLHHGLPSNQFTLTGAVESMDEESWTVAGQTIYLDEETEIEEGIAVGDLVQVNGLITEDSTFLAQQISLVDETPGYPFSFTGIVQAINPTSWVVAGQTITIDDETTIDEAVEVGDLVSVTGFILEDDTWLAVTIERQEEEAATFTITGVVDSLDPWQAAGITFETRDWTLIDPGIVVGNLVRVNGVILNDGTLVAVSIQKLTGLADQTIVLVGIVNSMDPWIVNGLTLFVDEATLIGEGIIAGSLVRVEIRLLPDGSWHTVSILPLDSSFGLGCFLINSSVVSYSGGQLVLSNWPTVTVGDGVQVVGNLVPNSIISIQICIGFDGNLIIINNLIIIIHQVIVTPAPGPPPPDGSGKVTICKVPPGNPAAQHTIQVGASAVQSHLGSGSYLGPCR
ncbi:MAG: DUF5666 domain-containing protein [Chloroflexota bacterium]